MTAEGWGENKFVPGGRSKVKSKERGEGEEVKISFSLPPPPSPTVHFDCKSNMAGWITDRELITLARTNKTPAVRTIAELKGVGDNRKMAAMGGESSETAEPYGVYFEGSGEFCRDATKMLCPTSPSPHRR